MAGGKNPVDEALTRTGVTRAAALPLKAALLAALFAASALAVGSRRGRKGDAPAAPGAPDKSLDTGRDGGVY